MKYCATPVTDASAHSTAEHAITDVCALAYLCVHMHIHDMHMQAGVTA